MPKKISSAILEVEEIVPESTHTKLIDANWLAKKLDHLRTRKKWQDDAIDREIADVEEQLVFLKQHGVEPTPAVIAEPIVDPIAEPDPKAGDKTPKDKP